MLTTIANIISRTLCAHSGPQLRRVAGNLLYVECMDCGHQSHGIATGQDEGIYA